MTDLEKFIAFYRLVGGEAEIQIDQNGQFITIPQDVDVRGDESAIHELNLDYYLGGVPIRFDADGRFIKQALT